MRGPQRRPGLVPTRPRIPRASRPDRVAEQLREEISELMLREIKDPRVRLASVSGVTVSPDLRSANVRISAVGEDPQRQDVVTGMRSAEGFVRAQLGARLENLKTIPRLAFELDESIAYSVRINTMLKEIGASPNREDADREGEHPPQSRTQ